MVAPRADGRSLDRHPLGPRENQARTGQIVYAAFRRLATESYPGQTGAVKNPPRSGSVACSAALFAAEADGWRKIGAPAERRANQI